MNISLCLRWKHPIKPVYDQLYRRISRPLLVDDGVIVLDGADLVKFSFTGDLHWRCPHDYGFWGNPTLWKPGWIACATLDNTIAIIDAQGAITQTVQLPAALTTAILVVAQEMYFGIGAETCSIIKLDTHGVIVYETFLDHDESIRHPFALNGQRLWIPTNAGLFCLDAAQGNMLTYTTGITCISNPIIINHDVLVVARTLDGTQAIVRIDHRGAIVTTHPLPALYRAQLHPRRDETIWLVGSSVSPWDAASPTDMLLVAQVAANGHPLTTIEVPPYRAIEALVDTQDYLWIGGYTDEGTHAAGILQIYTPTVQACLAWVPDPGAGVGMPALSADRARPHFLTTSSHVICFHHDP